MNNLLRLFLVTFIFMSNLYSDLEMIEGDDVDIKECQMQPLFVSLGSYCAPASLARSCGYRKVAFPFDWNIALDGEKLIEITEEYALRLHVAIKQYFPNLDFTLIIINNHEDKSVIVEKKIDDSILMIRAASSYEIPEMQIAYEYFFKELLQQNN